MSEASFPKKFIPSEEFNSNLSPEALIEHARKAFSMESALRAYPRCRETTIENGIRVVSESNGSHSATVGVFMDTGSRYESDPTTNGVAHFVEHMLFKGTTRRTRRQLEIEVENFGAQLNAYTTRETTVYSMKVVRPHIGRALDILGDMLTNSLFHPRAVESERSTILREARSVEENLQEVVMDHLHGISFPDQAIGRLILGTDDHIKTLTKQMMHDYVRNNFVGERMVVVAAGDVDHEELVQLTRKHLGHVPTTHTAGSNTSKGSAEFNPTMGVLPLPGLDATYMAYAFQTAGWKDVDLYPLFCFQMMLVNYLGGDTAALRHSNPRIRELAELNVTRSMSPFNTIYSDTGLFGLYMVHEPCEPEELRAANEIAVRNLLLCASECSEEELQQAKNVLKLSLLGQLDGSTASFEDIGRNYLAFGFREHPMDVLAQIEKVTPEDIARLGAKYFLNKDPTVMAVGVGAEDLQNYDWWRRPVLQQTSSHSLHASH